MLTNCLLVSISIFMRRAYPIKCRVGRYFPYLHFYNVAGEGIISVKPLKGGIDYILLFEGKLRRSK